MKLQFVRFLVSIVLMMTILWACNPFRPQIRKSPQGPMPKTFSLYSHNAKGPQKWWEMFKDPELNALVDEALSENFTIRQAWARLKQVNAVVVQAGAGLYPDLKVTAGSTYEWRKTWTEEQSAAATGGAESGSSTGGADSGSSKGGTDSERFSSQVYSTLSLSLGLISSYELDLWGRIRSEQEAARLEASATREDLYAAAVSTAAEVTLRWIRIISQRMHKSLLQDQLRTNETYLELVELRFRKAMASALDVYQQRQVVAGIKARIPLVEAEERLLSHQLALLMGKLPQSPLKISRVALPLLKEPPSTGLPADLLAHRPDIRAAGRRLRAADWQVASARANRLPAITLTAKALLDPVKLDLIFDNWMLNLAMSLAAGITAPLFDGNRRAAEVDRTRAVVDERLLIYRERVLAGIKEVEDTLVRETKQREHLKALDTQIDQARMALNEARERYRKGISDYLPVLTQTLSFLTLKRDRIDKQAGLLEARVALYRSLGGSWAEEGLMEKKGRKRL